MARQGFAPYLVPGSGNASFAVRSQKYKTSEAIVIGTILQSDTNGELIVSAADPASALKGVALEGAGTKLNFGEPFVGQTVFATGRVQEVSYAIADSRTLFSCRQEDGSGNVVAPLQTHIGEKYGVAKDADLQWFIDRAETTAIVVEIVDIVESLGTHLGFCVVKFVPAVLLPA